MTRPHDHEGGVVGWMAACILTAPTKPIRITKPQATLLRCIEQHGDSGWSEVELQYFAFRPTDGPWCFESFVLARVMDALVRRGMAVNTDEGPRLTEAGERWLAANPGGAT
ncbi:MAG TPA: hypothetical protein VFB99_13775 [Vicinamibacterales bacterium]|nr:hypothetical protein [Vicinamibacterales bacterium]